MPIKILMPALSPTMTEGNLANWLKKEGDAITPGDVIAEIETDKATMEVEAVDEGKLGKIVVPAGTEGVTVNDVIALLLEEGEDEAALDEVDTGGGNGAAGTPRPKRRPTRPPRRRSSRSRGNAAAGAAALGQRPAATASSPARSPSAWPSRPGSIWRHSPAAARAAGSSRRISRRRWKRASARPRPPPRSRPQPPQPAAAAAAPAPAPAAGAPDAPHKEISLSNMRKVIARRLTESKQQIPHFYLTVDCELDALLKLRKDLNARPGADYKLSVNDLIIKATAIAIRQKPAVNAIVGRRQALPARGHRRLGRGRHRRWPDHADHPQSRPEGPRRPSRPR